MRKIELIKGPFIPQDRIQYADNSVVSQQLTYTPAGNLTLFSFDKGQQLSEHTAPFDAICQILDGTAEIHVGGDIYEVTKGQMLIMPANIPHALYAKSEFKMLLIMIRG